MIQEYEGKTEKEAIEKAIADLGLSRDEFDVEIQDEKKGLFFKKGSVKIRVHVSDDKVYGKSAEPEDEFEEAMVEFLEGLLTKMGCDGKVTIGIREENKIMMMINSTQSGILIGRRGATLDALQLVANVYAGKIGEDDTKIILDAEGYRKRREDSLVRLARKTADQVRKTRTSKLLDFMNPYERRLIHTSLSTYEDIDTISEGEGLYKQVRVIFKGSH